MSEDGVNDIKSEQSTTSSSSFVPSGNLYTDFSSDSVPGPVQPVQTTMIEVNQIKKETDRKDDKTGEGQPKKPKRKDWIDTENPFHCKPCEFVAQNIEEFQDHSLSYRHIKKTAEVLEMKVNTKKEEEKKKPISFNCEVCACSCNSESAWNSHLVGQKHRKNLEKQGAAKVLQKQKLKFNTSDGGGGGGPGFYRAPRSHGYHPYQKTQPVLPYNTPGPGVQCANDFAQYKEPLIGLEYVTEIQVTGQNPRYHCKLCDAKFDHNVKFPHLVGAKHRFNVLKEKSPSVAQDIRLGVKKRSELTGKLLDEAMKIEQREGRQQVKTCVEASPFELDTNTTTQGSFVPDRTSVSGRGRGFAARSRPYQKSPRGHPIKGMGTPTNRGGLKRTPNQMNYPPTFSVSNQGYQDNYSGFGNIPEYQGAQMRGRGGGNNGRGRARGRGRGGPYSTFGRGFNNKANKQNLSFTSTSQYQPNNLGFGSGNQFTQSSPGRMLPRAAFTPRSPPRPSQPDYNNTHFDEASGNMNQASFNDQTGFSPMNQWNDAPAVARLSPPLAGSASKPKDSTAQNLLKGLTDLGKLVSSEEDASVALQVSNALTQALLQYRMQNLQEEGQN